ncbi:hypothetical protein [Mucilaginibacter sp. CSA2-8R]|uniref:hypothetical protein n=1 Tax=Mucilaginibacter sp. CSA2-8R TaxID=3141542 RepID=UPI00315D3545
MDNSYFVYAEPENKILIERLHICTWEFKDETSLIEFGFEIDFSSIEDKKNILLNIFIPWLNNDCIVEDFYLKLSTSNNSRFIFNDSITHTVSLDGGRNLKGVIHEFKSRNQLCIHPIEIEVNSILKKINVGLDLSRYLDQIKKLVAKDENVKKPNLYFRFAVKPRNPVIATIRNGITKSTILYDIKVNERRNIPEELIDEIEKNELCVVNTCFCFNIVPNSYDLVFFDNSSLQSVRTLEYEAFKSYLNDSRIKKDELLVVFNKRSKGKPFSFFNIYAKERIGAGQFALATLVSFVSGIFLFIPAYRKSFKPELTLYDVWTNLPSEIYIGFGIILLTLILFLRYYLLTILKSWYQSLM